MALDKRRALTLALAIVFIGEASAHAQVTPSREASRRGSESRNAQRDEILNSERWRAAQHNFHEWLSIQQIYSPDEVSALKAEIAERVAQMWAPELKAFLIEMEDRLNVLMSPDAAEARQWISQILATARNPESQFGGPLPDVANMTASQIRDELERFQQRRASRQRAQAAFDASRQNQVQAARDEQATRRETLAQPRTAATFVEPSHHSPYAPRRAPRQAFTGPPIYRIGPWGEPIFWSPLNDWHPWRSTW